MGKDRADPRATPPGTPAAWDRLPLRAQGDVPPYARTQSSSESENWLARVSACERVYARFEHGIPTPGASSEIADFARDLVERRRVWSRSPSLKAAMTRDPGPQDAILERGVLRLVLFGGLGLLLITSAGAVALPLVLPVAGVVLVAAFLLRRWSRDPRSAMAGRCCPDCGYDFSGLPDAVPAAHVLGESVGPRACPECGASWPMVPPAPDRTPIRAEPAG